MQEKKESLIYVLTNPSFPKNCIKIGYTQNLKQRLRSLNTGCPSNFEVYCTYKISAIANGAPDKLIHKLLIKLVPDLQIDPKKEFFTLPPQDAYEILQCIAKIHNREDCLILNTNNKITIYKENKNLNANFVSNNNLSKIYYAREAKLLSKGNGKFVLLKDSVVHRWPSDKLANNLRYQEIKSKQDDLIKKGLADFINGKLTILKDIEYDSPSAPAYLVCCTNINGWVFWKDENGKSLDENERKKEI
ncbi:DUF4357 domain-containing protein [Mycoplasmoides alvi]|uniref:DUF4357 domain-containing protein n=1 Tax=Mycoplasmoides alvi TaxID=78580 RepID=UPI0006979C59|nr:DUF4357 domain-containing protein [Mycoplasmoides alvi]